MGRYIVFREVSKNETLISFRAGSLPNSFGRFLEQNLSLNYDGGVVYSLDDFVNETITSAKEQVEEVKFEIFLDLIKKDFENYQIREKFEEYEDMLQIVGMIKTIVELFETHNNELEIHYG